MSLSPKSSTAGAPQEPEHGSPQARGLPISTIAFFALPVLPVGFIMSLTDVYFVKFGTDVLLVAPASLGLLFAVSRLWQAFCDPIAGFLSDRTRIAFGRRRSWMLASVFPLVAFSLMLWSPPDSLAGGTLIAWLAVAAFGLFSAASCFQIPYSALGAELSTSSTDRTRLFGTAGAAGGLAALVAMTLGLGALRTADSPRSAAVWLFGFVGAVALIIIPIAVGQLREPDEHRQKAPLHPITAYRDVLANPHARRLLLLNAVGALGSGSTAVLAPFYMQYVVGAAHLTEVFIGLYFIPTLASIPIWVRLARRFEKRKLWMASLALGIPPWAGLFFVPEGMMVTFLWLPALMGFAGGCGMAIPPAINADVIDYDEYLTGERKEGSYTAAGALVGKAGGAVMVAAAGAAIGWSGFVANSEQSDATRLVIRALMCLPPIASALAGMAILARFRLDEHRVADVRAELDRRST